MNRRDVTPKPKWWQLYLTFPLLLGLFLLDTRLHISTGGHEIVQMGSLLLEFGLVQWWLKSNGSALTHLDDDEISRTLHVIEIRPATPAEDTRSSQHALLLQPGEIPGVLADTFEMDYADSSAQDIDADVEGESR